MYRDVDITKEKLSRRNHCGILFSIPIFGLLFRGSVGYIMTLGVCLSGCVGVEGLRGVSGARSLTPQLAAREWLYYGVVRTRYLTDGVQRTLLDSC